MKTTLEERFRKKMLKIAKKNIICRIGIFPIYCVGTGVFGVVRYVADNGKRLAMLTMSLLLAVVYSSFSFPMFVTGTEVSGLKEVSEEALGIGLAQENEIDMGEIVLLGEQGIADILDNDESNTYIDDKIKENIKASEFRENTEDTEPVKEGVPKEDEQQESVDGADEVTGDSEGIGDGESTGDSEVTGDNTEETEETTPTFSADDWNLMLVNKQHFVPDDYEFPMGCINTDRGAMYCDERTIEPLLAMFDAAAKDGVTLRIQSPYRDKKYQKYLFDRKVKLYMDKGLSYLEAFQEASTIVTVPGASEHQTGMAFDLLSNNYNSLDYGFGETAAGKWLAEHCHEYGFILRYPAGKQHITDIIYEPWHFRYVGVEAATIIMEEEITLEEFWEEYL